MSTTATENVTPTSSASTENTQFTYDQATGLVTKTFTSDGLTLEFCYYPADASTGTPDRSDKVPDVTQLLSGFTLENVEATSLVDALTLKCESLPDKSTPPLMAQCEYLTFPDGTRSTTTLTLYGYANATIDNAGVLIPDTVLNLEGVAVDTTTTPWTVTQATGRQGITVALQQLTTARDGLEKVTTSTQWHKNDTARQTRSITETTQVNSTAGTLTSISTTPMQRNLFTPIATLSNQVRSARSGRVLRETQQDDLGNPALMVYHTYDARDRLLGSTTQAWEEEGFATSAHAGIAVNIHETHWLETGNGTWVRTVGPDGRCGRTLLDGLQRPVRREMQRVAGDDHSPSNYVCLEEVAYGADGERQHQCVYDYLPGGLRLVNEGATLSENLRDWFWEEETHSHAQHAATGESLTTESVSGTLLQGPLRSVQKTQRNHRDGKVTLTQSHKHWDAQENKFGTPALSIEEHIDTQGQRVRVKESLVAGAQNVEREWECVYDELGRRTQITTPDKTVVKWNYQGLCVVPVKVTLTPEKGAEQVLGEQTLLGSGNRGDEIITRKVGSSASRVEHTFSPRMQQRPDGVRLWSEPSEDGAVQLWYTETADSGVRVPKTLVASFSYNEVTQALHTERPATADARQSAIHSDSTAPQLLGTSQSTRTVRGAQMQRLAQHSLRGNVGQVQHTNGTRARTWRDGQNRRSRIRRGRMEYRYRYGAQGEVDQLAVLDLHSGRKLTVSMAYDGFARETERTYRLDGVIKSRYVQCWSPTGQLLSKTWYRNGDETATRVETFTYFPLRNELSQWDVDAIEGFGIEDASARTIKSQCYGYDALGNILTCTTTFTDDEIETRTYTYDANQPTLRSTCSVARAGKRKALSHTSDLNGSLTTNASGQALAYTHDGQLLRVSKDDRCITHYEYDEQGRLAAQWDETRKQRCILQYNDDQLCGEQWLDKQGKPLRRRVLDDETGLVVQCYEMYQDAEIVQTYFVMPDPQNTAAEEYALDAQGNWNSQSIGFTPWGEAPLARLNQMKSGVGFNGQRVDPVTGCYHLGNGYRVYEPRHQAFYQSDALSPFGEGGLNDRAYCAGRDPVNWHDPSGHIMINRREGNDRLASLDDMIRDTTPPHHEAAAWWEWALWAAATALAVVGSFVTGGLLGVVLLIIAVAASALGAAELALRQRNPALAEKLGWSSLALSLFDASGKGLAKVGKLLLKTAQRGVKAIRTLRNAVKLQGLSSLFKASRRSRYLVNNSKSTKALSAVVDIDGYDLGGSMKNMHILSKDPNLIPGIGIFDDWVNVKSTITHNAELMSVFATTEEATIAAARTAGFKSPTTEKYLTALTNAKTAQSELIRLRDESARLKKSFNTDIDQEYRTCLSASRELQSILSGTTIINGEKVETVALKSLTADTVDDFASHLLDFDYKYSDAVFIKKISKLISEAVASAPSESTESAVRQWKKIIERLGKQLDTQEARLKSLHTTAALEVKNVNTSIQNAFETYQSTTYPKLKRAGQAYAKELRKFTQGKHLGLSAGQAPQPTRPALRLNINAHGYADDEGIVHIVRYEPIEGRPGKHKPVRTSPKKFHALLGSNLKARMRAAPDELKKITGKTWANISDAEWQELSTKRYQNIRLLSCHLGYASPHSPNGESFAQTFSNLTGKPVKASMGRLFISSADNKSLFNQFKNSGLKDFTTYFRNHFKKPQNHFLLSKQRDMVGDHMYYGSDVGINYSMRTFNPTAP